jgi:large subunit ribosomal protein L22
VPGVKTNEVPGTRAVLRHYRMSAYKARQVLDLIRGRDADRAEEILNATPREAARVVAKVLASAVANARNNNQLDPDELFVSACYADEGTTLKRWRPRARGRATRIRKRTCHITVIVSRLPEDKLERRRARNAAETAGLRSRRVAASRRGDGDAGPATAPSERAADIEVDDLDATSTDVVEDGDEVGEVDAEEVGSEVDDVDEVDGEAGTGVETEAEVAADDDGEFEEPAWLNDELAETDAETETETEEEAPPAPKPRRTRGARKRTTKASADADEGDAGAPGEEEKD